jgi:peptide chain release factor 3
MDEGVAQLFTKIEGGRKIIGTVGSLQFEVIQYRLLNEYGASCDYEPIHLYKACWISSKNPKALEEFKSRRRRDLAQDKDDKLVFLAESSWQLKTVQEAHPDIDFHFTSEF